jgi:hypothetical protein
MMDYIWFNDKPPLLNQLPADFKSASDYPSPLSSNASWMGSQQTAERT